MMTKHLAQRQKLHMLLIENINIGAYYEKNSICGLFFLLLIVSISYNTVIKVEDI